LRNFHEVVLTIKNASKAGVDTSSASALLVRDRLTWMVYLQLATFGYFLYAFTPSITLLRDEERTSKAISALHGTGFAVGAIAVGLLAPRLVGRFGRGRMMWAALATMCVGIGIFVSCEIVAITILGSIVAGFGGTMVVNISSAALTSHHAGTAGGTAVTEANGLGSGLGIVAPLLVGGSVAIGLTWRPGVLVAVAISVVLAVVFGRSVPGHALGDAARAQRLGGRLPREYWRAAGVLVKTTAIEFSMTIWSSDVLRYHGGLSKGVAALGVTAIVAGMTTGRLTTQRLTLGRSADALLLTVFGITLMGFALFWLSTIAVVAFAGLFVTGLGLSLHFPLAITRAIGFSDGHADLATSYGSLGTGLAIAVAPFGLGALADHVGSHTAMLLVPLFVVIAAIGVVTTKRQPDGVRPQDVPVAVGDIAGAAD